MASAAPASLDAALASIAREQEQLAAWRHDMARSGQAREAGEQALEQACAGHLAWLQHRHQAWHHMARSAPPRLPRLGLLGGACLARLGLLAWLALA